MDNMYFRSQKNKTKQNKKTKKKPCFTGATDRNLLFLQIFSPKSCKISCFLTKIKDFSWKFLKISQDISKKFQRKMSRFIFSKFFVFLGSFLLPEIKKKKKKKRPTNPTWQVRPPVKLFFCLDFFFWCVCVCVALGPTYSSSVHKE